MALETRVYRDSLQHQRQHGRGIVLGKQTKSTLQTQNFFQLYTIEVDWFAPPIIYNSLSIKIVFDSRLSHR